MAQGIEEYMATITDKTKIPLGIAIIAIGAAAIWMTTMNWKADRALALAEESVARYEKLSSEMKNNQIVQYQMATDIAVTKTTLQQLQMWIQQLLEQRKGK